MSAAKKAKSNPFIDATAGAIAGCAARFVVGPLDVIKIRFQVQLEPIAKRAAGVDPTSLTSKYTGLRQALTTIVKEEGIQVQRQWSICLSCTHNENWRLTAQDYTGAMERHIARTTADSAIYSSAICHSAASQILCASVRHRR